MSEKHDYRVIVVPRHPDDAGIPDSELNFVLPGGALVQIRAPLFSKTMDTLAGTLELCRDSLVRKPDDFQI